MNAWAAALTTDTIRDALPDSHLDWLTNAQPGSRLARHISTGEIGHVYPDVRKNPYGWLTVATKTAAPSVNRLATPSTPTSDR